MLQREACRWWRCFRLFVLLIFTLVFVVILYTPPYRFNRPKEVVGWELEVVRDARIYVAPSNDTTLVGKELDCPADTLLCIAVISAPHNAQARSAIRSTWAASLPSHVTLVFLLGLHTDPNIQNKVKEESDREGDLVVQDFVESYNNLTVKSLLMLKWFGTKCKNGRFLLKTDDDMYINVTGLIDIINQFNQTTDLLVGSLIRGARPILDHRNKWYSPKYMFGGTRYPDYVSGTAYLMSSDVVSRLYSVALSTPIFHLEDVYITGICASAAGVKRQGDGRFSYRKVEVGCFRHLIAIHEFTPSELLLAWTERFTCSRPTSPTTPA